MKIGIDGQACQGQATGLGVYTQNLIQSLFEAKPGHFDLSVLQTPQQGPWNTPRRLYWENCQIPRRAKREKLSLLHVPAFSPPFQKPCRLIVTVHDIIGKIFPNQRGWPSRFYWGTWLPACVQKADALIADSENTKRDLIQRLKIQGNKIHVIYPSGHEGFRLIEDGKAARELHARLGIRGKYFLAVGTLEPRKNFLGIIRAFAKFLEGTPERGNYQLVAVGSTKFAHGNYFRDLLAQTGAGSLDIVFTGYLKKEELNILYSFAQAFLFPSHYEGFGIPLLEAMASGTPVLTARTSSLPEVAGEAAYYADSRNVDSIAEGMRQLAGDSKLRNQLVQKGFERIQRFSWKKTAEETLKVYELFL